MIVGLGVVFGNLFAGKVVRAATLPDGTTDFTKMFSIPMWIAPRVRDRAGPGLPKRRAGGSPGLSGGIERRLTCDRDRHKILIDC